MQKRNREAEESTERGRESEQTIILGPGPAVPAGSSCASQDMSSVFQLDGLGVPLFATKRIFECVQSAEIWWGEV